MKNIFIIGEQRSGSNLLRLILSKHSTIAAPHPPHILTRFMPLLPLYGDLHKAENFCLLIEDVCTLVERNPVSWNLKFDRKVVEKACKENSLMAIFDVIMNVYVQEQKKEHWICKSLKNVEFAKELETFYQNPIYIYLHRDPRDVVLSFKKAVVGEKHPYFSATHWTNLQLKCLELKKTIPLNRFFEISYQQLTQEPEKYVPQMCRFLGINYSEDMLLFYQQQEAKKAAAASSLWENLKKPILKENTQKYKNELPNKEILIVEKIAQKELKELGYQSMFSNQEIEEFAFSEKDIESFSLLNIKEKKQVRAQAQKEDLERRTHQLQVLENVRKRILPKHKCL